MKSSNTTVITRKDLYGWEVEVHHGRMYTNGTDECGHPFTAQPIGVRAINTKGESFLHFYDFCEPTEIDYNNAPDEVMVQERYSFGRSVEEAEEAAGKLVQKIRAAIADGTWAGPKGSKHWRESDPVYGSDAYLARYDEMTAIDRKLDEDADAGLGVCLKHVV